MPIEILEFSATLVALIGSFLVACKISVGFLFFIAANLMWIAFDLYFNHYGQLVMYAVFTLTAAYGYWNWAHVTTDNNKN